MMNILDSKELEQVELTIKQRLRILKSRKKYAVLCVDNLYLVNDLERLFFDRLRAENIYNALVYQLN
jgi:hypothetical protein